MPDIRMCMNEACPSSKKCYRFTAKPNPHRQSYSYFADLPQKGGKCEAFIDNKDKK